MRKKRRRLLRGDWYPLRRTSAATAVPGYGLLSLPERLLQSDCRRMAGQFKRKLDAVGINQIPVPARTVSDAHAITTLRQLLDRLDTAGTGERVDVKSMMDAV